MSPPVASTSGCGCCRRRRASHPLEHTAAAALPCLPSPLVDATVAAASGGGARPAPDRGSQCGQGTAAAPHPPRSWVPLVGRTGAATAAFAAAIAAARASSPRPLSTRRREGRSMGPRRRRCRLACPPSRHHRVPGAAVGAFRRCQRGGGGGAAAGTAAAIAPTGEVVGLPSATVATCRCRHPTGTPAVHLALAGGWARRRSRMYCTCDRRGRRGHAAGVAADAAAATPARRRPPPARALRGGRLRGNILTRCRGGGVGGTLPLRPPGVDCPDAADDGQPGQSLGVAATATVEDRLVIQGGPGPLVGGSEGGEDGRLEADVSALGGWAWGHRGGE